LQVEEGRGGVRISYIFKYTVDVCYRNSRLLNKNSLRINGPK